MCIFIHAHIINSRQKVLPILVRCSTSIAHFHNILFFTTCYLFLLPRNKLTNNDSTDHKPVFTWLMRNSGRNSAWNQTVPFLRCSAHRCHSVVFSTSYISVSGTILACKNGCRLQNQQGRYSLANLAARFQWLHPHFKILISNTFYYLRAY